MNLTAKVVCAAFALVLFVLAAVFAWPRGNPPAVAGPSHSLGWLGAAFLTLAIALP